MAEDSTNIPTSARNSAAPRAFSVEQFCQRFGIGRTSVYQEIRLGRLRARKIGRRTIITEDDGEAWLQRLPVIESTGEAVS